MAVCMNYCDPAPWHYAYVTVANCGAGFAELARALL